MTTAATFEKMTNAEFKLFAALRNFLYDHILLVNAKDSDVEEMAEEIYSRFIREAARRLSAPDVGKPVIEGDLREGVALIIRRHVQVGLSSLEAADEIFRAIAERHATAAPAPAAPRVGDDALVERIEYLISPYLHPMTAVETRRAVAQEIAALSAPPAASADERGELARLIDPRAWEPDHKGAIAAAMATRRDDTLAKADAILAAGYRKLVPAQSVGQSEAQGVATLEDIKRWCEQHIEGVTGPYGTALQTAIDALSALPKGPDHG